MTTTDQTSCPGCIGRGTGTRCCMCDKPIPAALRRTNGDAYPGDRFDTSCPDCCSGRIHTHLT
ncbi:hypothetical protein [Spongiactinospora sp. TRM90649]|uniref:hypothetical protein n=1 Tax=Spongiactinospora sp. TRM90649 TaxID=3031114 RepID=UPI0023FA378E|nr:hypothetical protein [Spongiactinospora sp. TRM90649]MDF5759186.1 hypothetical protein [Spongiactinospora sp. TRM90649]